MIQFTDFSQAHSFSISWENFKTKLSGTGKTVQTCFQSFELWTEESLIKLVMYDDAQGRVQEFLDEINEDPAGSLLRLSPRAGTGSSFYTRRFEGVTLKNDHVAFGYASSDIVTHKLTLSYTSTRTILHGRSTEDE